MEEKSKLQIKLLNIQCLTEAKKYELRRLITVEQNNIEIIALVETHVRNDRFTWRDDMKIHEKRREEKDKKGGGLLIMYKDHSKVKLEEVIVQNNDILVLKGTIGRHKITIVLVYYATRTSSGSKEINRRITSCLEEIMENTDEEEHVMIMGDFNGHLGWIGDQKLDENGKIVKEIAYKYNMTIANMDEKCTGQITWRRGEQKSAIDYMLINSKLYSKMEAMNIDEKKEQYDLSDHNVVQICFKWTGNNKWHNKNKQNTKYYYKMNEKTLEEYVSLLETKMEEVDSIQQFNHTMKETADKMLKRKYTRKMNKEGEEEPPWINREIKEGIKERRKINRERRNEPDERKRQILWTKYIEKKLEVQQMIKNRIYEYETQMTNEIKQDSNKMWQNIRKLKGQKTNKEVPVQLHYEDGTKIEEDKQNEEVLKYWNTIYKMHRNETEKVWNDQERTFYEENKKESNTARGWTEYPPETNDQEVPIWGEITYPIELREHMDMVMKADNQIRRMDKITFEEEEVIEILRKVKKGKAAGPDGLKGELYKTLTGSNICMKKLTSCFNKILTSGTIPEEWKKSRTVLLEKKKKATVKDLRPLALTNISYKIFMSLLKIRIEKHIERNGEIIETQAGFTKGARVEDNLAILKYLRQEASKRKEELIITAIDFSKAYDSVKRHVIVDTLKLYGINAEIINIIAELYKDDRVILQVGGKEIKEEVKPTSGIRQGCTLSATLFKMITYRIIKDMESKTNGYNTGNIKIKSLFFADDGLLINSNITDAENAIRQLQTTAGKYGLAINKEKSNVLWINPKDKKNEIAGVKVVKEIKYLGITLSDSNDMFKTHKENKLKLAEKLANITYSVMVKSCNRLLVGKTYWKSVAVPAILYGSGIIEWTEKEQQRLQTLQNLTCRRMLNAPIWTTNSGLKGEIGLSSMQSRITQSRLCYLNNRRKDGNELIKFVIKELETGKGKWKTYSERQCVKIGISQKELHNKSKQEIKDKIYKADTDSWKLEMSKKKTLEYYRAYKKEVKQEEEYENNRRADLWFRTKTNCLYLGDRNRSDKRCKLCGHEREDLEHFLIHCPSLEDTRRKSTYLQRPLRESNQETMTIFIFSKEDTEHRKTTNERLWKKRDQLLKDLDN